MVYSGDWFHFCTVQALRWPPSPQAECPERVYCCLKARNFERVLHGEESSGAREEGAFLHY